ncbi:2,3-diaminopropionate biosynthesis protein SbnA [Streptomyces lunaelactis]|uniref:N-(2-amino-2-carboxyethyl)-L-glutamate synthase n=1 Tax=Streptomyces lunaelactis TaxID=1535768 RepID=A0A2R4T1W3_9ACTN|nr:2,3-diaminopropionate biosynthesis protein SbnA [Streptomyces lunaelactis]AVZ73102.1 2,3-diaminopropionate biosynthesis protein SbnA [Streptomyces lunaelactis]NUK03892.1 2,3-diaminopropionate biosynthesis protein SbnA [Streptomyces lunaelactis]NUK10797.1 2,3-diaminopropionate biosynthesis protein SbnA [Streptomyces lunaelactis]NUK18916.1 2,3-diaminopropionate biosynthesis protein SbnA [Streptomyces lunaelactis]NUK26332.1 2,3-diaminopropionate biosynthesis protein SbnA [Streptomyces lunaelac
MGEPHVKGILSAVGGTPLVELEKLAANFDFRVFAKVERFNPGGSIKDRPALNMLLAKVRAGELVPGRHTVIESSSGNLAVGLAQVCCYFGLRFVCVVDARTTEQNLAVLRAYGAEVEVVTEPDPASGEYLPQRLYRVAQLAAGTPYSYVPDQYANPRNTEAHLTTMREIDQALDGRVDYVFCAAGTTGTLGGCAAYVRQRGLRTSVVAVDAVGSVLFDSPVSCSRLIPGHGTSVTPSLFDPTAADHVVHVTDLEAVVGCRRLVRREALLAGGSSGALVAALEKMAPAVKAGSTVVLVLPDGGDRYLDTVYSDTWVRRHFGEVSHLWAEPVGPPYGSSPEPSSITDIPDIPDAKETISC